MVSGCGIASAYLTPLVASHLEPVAQTLEVGQALIELGRIAGEERPLTAHTCGVRCGAYLLPERQRSRQHLAVAPDDPKSPPSLRLEWTNVTSFRSPQQLAQPIGRQRLARVEQPVEAAFGTLGKASSGPRHLAQRLGDRAQVSSAIAEPAVELTVGGKGHQDGVENFAIRLCQAIILARAGHVDDRHEPPDGIACRRLARFEPELARALSHEERLIPATE